MFPETIMDWVIITYIVQYASLAGVIAWVIKGEIQPKALIFRERNKTHYRIATINLKREWDCFFFDKKAYMIDWEKVAYHTQAYWHHVPRLFYLENEGEPLDIYGDLLNNKGKLNKFSDPPDDTTEKIKKSGKEPLDITKDHVPSQINEDIMKKLYMVAKEKVVKQLVSASTSFMQSWGTQILFIILALGCGIGLGWILHTYLQPAPVTTGGG